MRNRKTPVKGKARAPEGVAGHARLHCDRGMPRLDTLHALGEPLLANVDARVLGRGRSPTTDVAGPVEFAGELAPVLRVVTVTGYELVATASYKVHTRRGPVALGELATSDALLIAPNRGLHGHQGSEALGRVLGHLTGDGYFPDDGLPFVSVCLRGPSAELADELDGCMRALTSGSGPDTVNVVAVPECNAAVVRSTVLAKRLTKDSALGVRLTRVPEVVWQGSLVCVRAYLQALFETLGRVNVNDASQSCSTRMATASHSFAQEVQVLLSGFGVFSSIAKYSRVSASGRELYELIIDGQSRDRFMDTIGFATRGNHVRYETWAAGRPLRKSQRFESAVALVEDAGFADVYRVHSQGRGGVILNGIAGA